MTERLTYTVPEVARLMGVSRGVAYTAVKSGDLPGVIRLGRRVLVSRHALEQLLGSLPDDAKGGEPIEEVHGPAAPVSVNGRGDAHLTLGP